MAERFKNFLIWVGGDDYGADKISVKHFTTQTNSPYIYLCLKINVHDVIYEIDCGIKDIPNQLTLDTFLSAFYHYYNILKGIHHENILQVKQLYQVPNSIYVFYQFYSQQQISFLFRTLEQYFMSSTQIQYIQESDIISFFIQVAQGVLSLHEHGITHGKINLGSVLIDQNSNYNEYAGHLKIANYGLTRLGLWYEKIRGCSYSQRRFFSPQYVSNSKNTDKGDVWSCGVLLYEMIQRSGLIGYDRENMCDQRTFYMNIDEFLVSQQTKELLFDMIQLNQQQRPKIKEIVSRAKLILENLVDK